MFNVTGKVALVTGALGGIGRCITKNLLRSSVKGVALLDINESAGSFREEIEAEFGADKTLFIRADLTETKQIEDAYERVIQHYKQLDIVVNNAGIFGECDVLKCMQINYVAPIFSTHLALRKYLEAYRKDDEAVIVNMASVAGIYPFPILPVYGSAKHGIIALGRSFGHESHYNSRKVKVLTICPGPTDTALLDQLQLFPDDIREPALETAKKFIIQSPENVGKTVLDVIRNAKSGSVWVVKQDKAAEEIDFSEVDTILYKSIK